MSDLEKENKILKYKLKISQNWMKREVISNIKMINSSKMSYETKKVKKNFFSDNIKEIVYKQAEDFFGENIFMYISKDILENIISSEILFFTLRENKNLDGLGIITSYQKSFDLVIEEEVSKPFRKFFNSLKIKPELKNDLIEKTLYSVIFKGHILGFGKLFALLQNISQDKGLLNYSQIFKDFLDKYSYLKNILLNKEFLILYEKLINLETFGEKRHIGKVDFDDVLETRKIFLGDFKDKNCLFVILLGVFDI